MKLKHRVGLLIVTGLLTLATSRAETKDQRKHLTSQRGGEAATEMSGKGTVNNNTQWSADPTRGWVRAEEPHELRKSSGAKKQNSHNGKAKTKSN